MHTVIKILLVLSLIAIVVLGTLYLYQDKLDNYIWGITGTAGFATIILVLDMFVDKKNRNVSDATLSEWKDNAYKSL